MLIGVSGVSDTLNHSILPNLQPNLQIGMAVMALLLFSCSASVLSYSQTRSRGSILLDKLSGLSLLGSLVGCILWAFSFYRAELALDADLLIGLAVVSIGTFLLFFQRILLAPSIIGPIALFFLMRSYFLSGNHGTGILGSNSLLLNAHIGFAVVGQAFALVSPILALFYLVQSHLLKNTQSGFLMRGVPGLDKLQTWLMFLLQIGLVFISFALLTGVIYAAGTDELAAMWPKTIWAFVIWCWYISVLMFRIALNKSMRDVAVFSIFGAILAAIGWGVFYA